MKSLRHTALAAVLLLTALAGHAAEPQVCLRSLLREMVSPEANALWPDPAYRCLQSSSYDRRSVSPDSAGWYANDDGYGILRMDTANDGGHERVMLDCRRPGVITRFWITTLRKDGTLRFYFDGEEKPSLTVPAYDLSLLPVDDIMGGLVLRHTSYEPGGKGGETCFLPIPFAKSCKVTFEDAPGVEPSPKYYQINYREYDGPVDVETFSLKAARQAAKEIKAVNELLQHPATDCSRLDDNRIEATAEAQGAAELCLPAGANGVYQLTIKLDTEAPDSATFARWMRKLVVRATFDGRETVRCPLSDFCGGGFGAPEVRSFFLESDGRGTATCRYLMPYRDSARIAVDNANDLPLRLTIAAHTAPLAWTPRSLYFHTTWQQHDMLRLTCRPERDSECSEWRFCDLKGRGVYKGDVLTVCNYSPKWYGEGDEKIWVDGDTFPSHFGTGTEDYYNSSWAPVYVFHTPFGGAPRADQASSHGYNTFFRTRCLDGIPFSSRLRFDLELISWLPGYADYASTVFWYGI